VAWLQGHSKMVVGVCGVGYVSGDMTEVQYLDHLMLANLMCTALTANSDMSVSVAMVTGGR
jgi:hypothetical protein